MNFVRFWYLLRSIRKHSICSSLWSLMNSIAASKFISTCYSCAYFKICPSAIQMSFTFNLDLIEFWESINSCERSFFWKFSLGGCSISIPLEVLSAIYVLGLVEINGAGFFCFSTSALSYWTSSWITLRLVSSVLGSFFQGRKESILIMGEIILLAKTSGVLKSNVDFIINFKFEN